MKYRSFDPKTFRARGNVRYSFITSNNRAQAAIYFDYEGFPDQEPVLLGWYVDGRYQGAIVDENYVSCATHLGTRNVEAAGHRAVVRALLALAQAEDRNLVSWSHFDARHFLTHCNRLEWDTFQSVYVDARQIARAWHKNTKGVTPAESASLAYFAEQLKIPRRPEYKEHTLATNLNAVHDALKKHGTYAAAPPAAKAAWRNVVRHNKDDAIQTRRVVDALLENDA